MSKEPYRYGKDASDAMLINLLITCDGRGTKEKQQALEELLRRKSSPIKWSREWAMPNKDTFSVKPIGEFVSRYLELTGDGISIDPFARNDTRFTYTNDLNEDTLAQYHMDAEDFCVMLQEKKVQADLVIMDPPYSPRQVSECYNSIGIKCGMKETQTALLYKRVRDAFDPLIKPNGIVLSFGWNTVGMGKKRNYAIEEIRLVSHGGAHNDTICMAERKM